MTCRRLESRPTENAVLVKVELPEATRPCAGMVRLTPMVSFVPASGGARTGRGGSANGGLSAQRHSYTVRRAKRLKTKGMYLLYRPFRRWRCLPCYCISPAGAKPGILAIAPQRFASPRTYEQTTAERFVARSFGRKCSPARTVAAFTCRLPHSRLFRFDGTLTGEPRPTKLVGWWTVFSTPGRLCVCRAARRTPRRR
jgi:hypothetical protein